jgi:predicted amidohydrolase
VSAFKAAAVQMRSGVSVERNLAEAIPLIRAAAASGADYVLTPEMTNILDRDRERLLAAIAPQESDPSLAAFRQLAIDVGIWLHVGSLAIRLAADGVANRSFLIAPSGEIAAQYDKIHMFDVDLAGGESYRESRLYKPGGNAVVADLPWGRLGLSVCYDVRFPQLYRALAHAGAEILAVPAAFTRTTGEAHWHVLLRARAIENGAFVISAAQAGHHEDGRDTYGHSLIIDPWGRVLAEAGVEPGVILAEIDPALSTATRGRVPSLANERAFQPPAVETARLKSVS